MKIYNYLDKLYDEKYNEVDIHYFDTTVRIMMYCLIFVFIMFTFNIIKNNWPKSLTYKVRNPIFLIYLLPLIGTIIFGLIDSLFFFIFEDDYLHYIAKFTGGIIPASLILGGISSFVAIYFGENMHNIIELITLHKLNPSALQQGIGILIGTFIVLIGYIIYRKFKKDKDH